jgi:hypothetical protein
VSDYAPDFQAVPRVPWATVVKQATEPAIAQPKGRQAFLSRVNKRRFASLAAANPAIKQLPGPGESLHGIMTGHYDLMQLLVVILQRLKSPCTVMRIATLSLSARNVQEMAALLDSKAVVKLDILASDFFRTHNTEIFAELVKELQDRGQRVAAGRSHCKVATIALKDGRRYTLEGSANLRTNKNLEQFALTQCPELHGFFDGWIAEMVGANEVHRSDDSQKG